MPLEPDDTICFCFHVSLRKIQNFCRIEKPKVASQISQCLSAGTGCGWCRPMLRKIHQQMCVGQRPRWREEAGEGETTANSEADRIEEAEAYRVGREKYLKEKGITPPGGAPREQG